MTLLTPTIEQHPMTNEGRGQEKRKERRFKTPPGEPLRCEVTVDSDDVRNGTVVDISPSGLRLLAEGRFESGDEFAVKLITREDNQPIGEYRGIVRRVEPWVGGKSVLGCQLTERIPSEILQLLAEGGVVDRRRDGRLRWNQSAKLNWELRKGELDVLIVDCAPGGLRLISPERIPEDKRLRIHVRECDEEIMLVEAKAVWQHEDENGFTVGVAFTKRGTPPAVQSVFDRVHAPKIEKPVQVDQPSIRHDLLIGTVTVIFLMCLLRTSLPKTFAKNVETVLQNPTVTGWIQSWQNPFGDRTQR